MTGITPELAAKRYGKMTGSMAHVVMGGENTEGLSAYVRELAGERVYRDFLLQQMRDNPEDGAIGLDGAGFKSAWMDRGTEKEEEAISWFEFDQGVTLLRQAFSDHPRIPNVAATPDGLLVGRYTVQAKCPKFSIWCETKEAKARGKTGLDAIPSRYRWQCRWEPWCHGLTESRFIAYHPAGNGQGVIIPYTVPQSDLDAMAARVVRVEGLIRNWVEILQA